MTTSAETAVPEWTTTSVTLPVDPNAPQHAPRLTVQATYRDPVSGALYVHDDLILAEEPWAAEQHVGPIATNERLGDVPSWVRYVQRFGGGRGDAVLLTWSSQGLAAVLDYHTDLDQPGRRQWTATCPFEPSSQWSQWMAFAKGQPHSQRAAIERLEDLAVDIVEPPAGEIVALLRSLRASVNAKADTELRPDGTSTVRFARDTNVKGGAEGTVDVPAEIGITVPVLRGHTDSEGRPVLYRVAVRVRLSVGDDARLSLRFGLPHAERVLEAVYADRVAEAARLLGDEFALLRQAD